MHATHKAICRQRHAISAKAGSVDAHAFFNLLTGPELFDAVELALPAHRERLFPPTETLSMFLAQALSADRSCQRAVNEGAIKRLIAGLTPCSTHTGAYCRARQRVPASMVSTLVNHAGQWLTAHAPAAWHWLGRPVRLVDGATVIMPDTDANQADFPQPGSQKPGLGFPQCRIVGLICLGSGAVLNAAISACRGKGTDEQSLLRRQIDTLVRGDVLVGDAFFATYFLLCALIERGVDAVFEQHGSRQRTTDFCLGQRLGERDHLLVLSKPGIKPDWMSQEDYAQAPASVTVRELRAGGKTLVTTFLCPKQTAKEAIKRLYRDRWHVELDLRNIKTTLGMEKLSCQTPAMAVKEVWVYLLAYNFDPLDDGSSSATKRPLAPSAEFQAYRASLARLGPPCLSWWHRTPQRTLRPHCPANRRQSPRPYRTSCPQATSQCLPATDPASPHRSSERPKKWASEKA